MNVGDRITSPWGDYVVWSLNPTVLRSGTSAIVGPSEDFLARAVVLSGGGMGEQQTPAVVFCEVQQCLSGAITPLGLAGANPALHPDEDHTHQFTLGAYRSFLSMAWTPNSQNELVWTPCASRSDVVGWELQTHVYFLGCVEGSIYCPPCRAQRPRILHVRDGNVVLRDSHGDFAPSLPVGFVRDGATGVMDFPSASELLLEAAPALCASSADEEFASSALSPAASLPLVRPTTGDVVGADAEFSAPALLAMTVAREEVPPASDAKEVSSTQEASPSTFPPDDPKESVGSFDRVVKCKRCGFQQCTCRPSPIGRPWLGLWEWKEWCAERAAIIEYDANWPRKNAEGRARDLAGSAPR